MRATADTGVEERSEMVFLSWSRVEQEPTVSVGPGSHWPSSAGKPQTSTQGTSWHGHGDRTANRDQTMGGRRLALINLVAFMVRMQVL